MLKQLKRYASALLQSPAETDGPETFTLAVPEAHSTFKAGDVGYPTRPPAVVRCGHCSNPFTHQFANDFINCPNCHFSRHPDAFPDLDLVGLVCPDCHRELDHGVRHPSLVEFPEWASCTHCQYHWEYQHDF